MKGLFHDVESFLANEDFTLPTLTLAAFMCNQKCQLETEKLQSLILKRISTMSFYRKLGMADTKRWVDTFRDPSMRPNVVWYNFFSNLVTVGPICAPNQDDNFWTRIFWIWDDCGLFRRKYNPRLWQSIRASVSFGFFSRQIKVITSLLGANRANALGSLLPEISTIMLVLCSDIQASR